MMADILIVDDEEGIRMLLNEILSHSGYQIYNASTGKEALDKLGEQSFQLLILDYRLPIMDGAEMLRELEVRGERIPVILMSGLTEHFIEEQTNSPNVKHIIAKPFDVQHLIGLVQAILPR